MIFTGLRSLPAAGGEEFPLLRHFPGSLRRKCARPAQSGSDVKLTLVTTIYPPDIGGPASYAWDVSRRLRQLGHEVTIVKASEGSSADPDVWAPPRSLPPIRYLRGVVRHAILFVQLLKRARATDLFFVQPPGYLGLLTIVAAGLFRRPVVARFPGDAAWERAFAQGRSKRPVDEFVRSPQGDLVTHALFRIQKAVVRRSARVISPSRYTSAVLAEGYGVPIDRVHTIHHSLDVEDYVSTARAHRREPGTSTPESPCLLYVGRLVANKQVQDLLDALSILREEFPKCRLLILGDGPERESLEQRVRSLSLDGNVAFSGDVPRQSVLMSMQEADVLVLPTVSETLSHVAIEALACGVPVVATRIPGLGEVLEDEVSALLVPPKDPASLANAIRRILASPELARTLSLHGIRRAQALFSWSSNLPLLEAVLLRAIDDGRHSRQGGLGR